ncbi:four-carbon acid sugar kinase family protein [Aquabacter sp. CN5-332]|uniref:four-carbon acid sugar kinase family protein n=1 Tax=Aquabacter sp. CN5-332 TaxID=3156608 RepID=UPI0032B383A7
MGQEITPGTDRLANGRQQPLAVAIIADDLSGALDSTAPFAGRGLFCAVAVTAGDIGEALATGASVVAVNTASRHLPAPEAAGIVTAAARCLQAAAPEVVFKKVDSRLKGNVGAETRAMMAATGRTRAVAVPAVPELGRRVENGCVVGTGVAEPLSVLACFDGLAVEVPDIAHAGELAAIARLGRAAARETLLVGARSLAAALAYPMGDASGMAFACEGPVAVVVGSRDPITLMQVERLRRRTPHLQVIEAPDGHVGDTAPTGDLVLFQCVPGTGTASEEAVAERFGAGVAFRLTQHGARTVLATGGDTAMGLMRALGVKVVHPRGEVLPGMPWSRIAVPGHGDMLLVTKSGGFGAADALASILRPEAADARH